MRETELPEPWLRGRLGEVPPVQRAVLHALESAKEDLERWCGGLADEELNRRPFGLAPVAFHIHHIARSLDRLLTYAEGEQLREEQLRSLRMELDSAATHDELFGELTKALDDSARRVRAFDPARFGDLRSVGKKHLPATLGGLLVHVADHTQRHVGQAITTARVVMAGR
jgi:uncharacterized damage-inducible protein DinB